MIPNPAEPRPLHRTLVVAALGLIGLVSLLAFPFEALAPTLSMRPFLFRALSLVQPAIFVVAAALAGGALAYRVGFGTPIIDALLCRRSVWDPVRRGAPLALVAGLMGAAALVIYGRFAGPYFAVHAAALPVAALDPPLVTRLLYGGLTEEVLLRWGLMSVAVWLAGRMVARRPVAVGLGLAMSTVAFAALHLPLLYLLTPQPPLWMVAAVIAGNCVPGALFGLAFARRGLEAAMLAHLAAHALAAVAAVAGWVAA